jgi:hypothetical protein
MTTKTSKTPKKASGVVYRLTAQKVLEVDRQAQIVDYLTVLLAQGRIAWFARINGGGTRVKGKGGRDRWLAFYRLWLPGYPKPISKAISDIIGQSSAGWFFSIEVKQPGEDPSTEQDAFLSVVLKARGRAIVATGWNEVREMFEK